MPSTKQPSAAEPLSDQDIDRLIAQAEAEERATPKPIDAVLAEHLDCKVEITYQGTKGPPKRRDVTIHKIERKNGDLMVKGFCQLADRPRSFKANRIMRLIDRESGEIVAGELAEAWIEKLIEPG